MTHVAVTLVIAEKKSVAVDVSKALEAAFKSSKNSLEGPDTVITWAVGHLAELAAPEHYDDKFKRWKMVDLPILPKHFDVVPRAEGKSAKEQLDAIAKLMKRDDIELIVNACDAGREGELIFAYVLDVAGKKDVPVAARLVLVDDEGRDPAGLRAPAARQRARAARGRGALALRGRLARRHERDARGDDPRPRRVRQHRRLARPRADADARDPGAAREGDPGLRADAVLARRRDLPARRQDRLPRPPRARQRDAHPHRRGRRRDRRARQGRRGPRHLALQAHPALAAAPALRPHRAAARGGLLARLHRPPHALGRPGLLREGRAHLSAYRRAATSRAT